MKLGVLLVTCWLVTFMLAVVLHWGLTQTINPSFAMVGATVVTAALWVGNRLDASNSDKLT